MDITYILEAGKRVVASKFNTNFNDVKTAVDALETDVADLQAEASNVILPDGSKDFTNLQSYKANAINNATNATPIVITAVAHGYTTGNKVFIKDVGGNTAANGEFTITRLTADTFSLNSSVGNGAYTSGGTAIIYPNSDENLTDKQYVDNKINAEFEKAKVHFGTSSTVAATAEKAVTSTGFTHTSGSLLSVVNANKNTASTLTLNVNSLGAKNVITHYGDTTTSFPAGKIDLLYDGIAFILLNCAGYGLPSDNYLDISLGASGSTYTFPRDGILNASRDQAGGTNFVMTNQNGYKRSNLAVNAGNSVIVDMQGRKGDVITYTYGTGTTLNLFRFFYAEGSQP